MFRHPDPGFNDAIVNGLTGSGEAFEIGRIKAEKVGVVGGLDYYRILEMCHCAIAFGYPQPSGSLDRFQWVPLYGHDNRLSQACHDWLWRNTGWNLSP